MTPEEEVITSMAAIVANQTHIPRDELLSHLSDPNTAVRLAEISGPTDRAGNVYETTHRRRCFVLLEPGQEAPGDVVREQPLAEMRRERLEAAAGEQGRSRGSCHQGSVPGLHPSGRFSFRFFVSARLRILTMLK